MKWREKNAYKILKEELEVSIAREN